MSDQADLPENLQRVISFSKVDPAGRMPLRAEFEQEGCMFREGLPHRPLPFTAKQYFTRLEFQWKAVFRIVPWLLSLKVEDSFIEGRGLMQGHALGCVRFMREIDVDTCIGEMYRYLGELPWAPWLFLAHPEFKWSEPAPGKLQVECEYEGQDLCLVYDVDDEGRVLGIRAESRPAKNPDGSVEMKPWVGRFADYVEMDGIMVPSHGAVNKDGEVFEYFDGRVTKYRLVW